MAEVCGASELLVFNEEREEVILPQLETLPLELLVEIFSYLGTRQDLISCCKVSKSFNAAAASSSLWKSLCRKVWRISKDQDDNWKTYYTEMYKSWGRYEDCYADIRQAWDLIEKYTEEYCPCLLHGLNPGASENELDNAETRHLNGHTLPDDYRCFLRIHNGQTRVEHPGVLGCTHIANHHKKEALLNAQVAASGIIHEQGGLRGCIPITICVINTCGQYLAITEEAGHKRGRVFWPSIDNATVNLSGDGKVHCFVMAENFTDWITSYAESMVQEHFPVLSGEIYPYKFASTDTGTNGITVKTSTCFLPEMSNINPPRFFFTYRITILMDPSFPKGGSCQLQTRHWYITDGNGEKEEVHGDAVVGRFPMMEPGAKHDYVSCTSFSTPTGTMEGHYTFKFLYKDGTTNARVAPMHFKAPTIELASERQQRQNANYSAACSDSETDSESD